MAEKKLVKLLLLMILSELLIFHASEAKAWWSRRRRCSSDLPAGVKWANSWKDDFFFQCRNNGKSVKIWRSEHRNCMEDRIHYFKCGYGPVHYTEANCAWTQNYVNVLDHSLVYKCPHNGFITGIQSEHDDGTNDRKFGFRCCHKHKYVPKNCKITHLLNNWDQKLDYRVPNKYYLVGVFSYHHNGYEDRRWQFEICQFSKGK